MFKRIKQFYVNNVLVKVASFNSVGVLVKLISGFIISKTMAVFIGPSGVAIVGNLSNFKQSLDSLSSLGVKNGTIKYIAESKEDKLQFRQIVSSSFLVTLCIGLLSSLLLLVFSRSLSDLIFDSLNFSYLFKVAALMMPFYSVHIFFISILNGLKKFKELIQINIVGYILITFLTVLLISVEELKGALLVIVITPFLLFLSLFWQYTTLKFIINNIGIHLVSKDMIKKLSSFFSMTLFSGIMVPIVFLIIRNYIIKHIGADEAGYWEGVRKISNYYMLFIFTLYQLYLLPSLSEKRSQLRSVVLFFYKTVLPVVGLGFVIIYFLKIVLIKLVFTTAFLPMKDLFLWQLLGDFFRIMFLTISYQFLAKKMIWPYIVCEGIYMIMTCFLSIYFINVFGLSGTVKAYAVACFAYLLLMLFVFRKELFKIESING